MASIAENAKKRIIIGYLNLTPDLLAAFRERYLHGYSEALIRIDKPNGEFFYAVPLETDQISYLVKVDVKIDSKPEEDLEKDYYGDDQDDESGDIAGAEQIADSSDDDE